MQQGRPGTLHRCVRVGSPLHSLSFVCSWRRHSVCGPSFWSLRNIPLTRWNGLAPRSIRSRKRRIWSTGRTIANMVMAETAAAMSIGIACHRPSALCAGPLPTEEGPSRVWFRSCSVDSRAVLSPWCAAETISRTWSFCSWPSERCISSRSTSRLALLPPFSIIRGGAAPCRPTLIGRRFARRAFHGAGTNFKNPPPPPRAQPCQPKWCKPGGRVWGTAGGGWGGSASVCVISR